MKKLVVFVMFTLLASCGDSNYPSPVSYVREINVNNIRYGHYSASYILSTYSSAGPRRY